MSKLKHIVAWQTLKYQFGFYCAVFTLIWFVVSSFCWLLIDIIIKGTTLEESNELLPLYIVGSLIILVLCILPFMYVINRTISKPMKKIVQAINELGPDNYHIHIDVPTPHEFAEIAQALNYMSAKWEEAEQIKESTAKERTLLFANMAHDLKTPITSIIGYSKALKDGMVTDPIKQSEYLDTINKKAVRMNELIDRLFEYVKLESPENILHKTNTDIAELLRTSVADIYTDFERNGITLDIDIPETPVIKCIDSLEIERVFINIMNNAIKHNPRGITVRVSMDHNGKVVIADTGTPVEDDLQKQLFKPFVSGDASRMSKNGSGLGLALSYKIMKKHNGDLVFESPYNEYTKAFIICFA